MTYDESDSKTFFFVLVLVYVITIRAENIFREKKRKNFFYFEQMKWLTCKWRRRTHVFLSVERSTAWHVRFSAAWYQIAWAWKLVFLILYEHLLLSAHPCLQALRSRWGVIKEHRRDYVENTYMNTHTQTHVYNPTIHLG